MKKIIALFLSILMIASMTALTASAEGEVEVKLVADKEVGAVAGSTYSVTLQIADATVGGVQGIVKYDKTNFDFVDITMTSSVAAANHIEGKEEDAFKVDKEAGKIDYILLCDGQNKNLATFNFTVLADKVDTANFTVTGVKVANAEGEEKANKTVDANGVKVSPVAITMDATSVRTNLTYDIRFKTVIDATFAKNNTIAEIGMILIPTKLVAAGKELINDADGSFCIDNQKPQIKTVAYDGKNTVYATINNTGATHMNRLYSLRAFVKLANGTIVYSDNEADNEPIQNGTISRSCKTTAIALYDRYKASYVFSQEAQDVAAKVDVKWTAEDYKTLAKENLEALMASENN